MAYLDYETLIEKELMNVAKRVLEEVNEHGIKDPHAIYITFSTQYSGVIMPTYLREEYPSEMTIILQYQFWELKVHKHDFSIILSFNEQEEELTIPFSSLINISDPSCNFGLGFNPENPKSPPDNKEKNKNNVVSMDRFRKK